MTAAAGPKLDPPTVRPATGGSRARAALGDAVAVAVMLVTTVCGILGCLIGFLGRTLSDGRQGASAVVVGAMLLVVALVAGVAEIVLLHGVPRARVALAMCAGAAAVLVAVGTLTLGAAGFGVGVAGLVTAAALAAAGPVALRMSTPGSRRPGVAAAVAVLLVHVFVLARLPGIAEILFRLVLGPSFTATAVSGLVLSALYVVFPLVGTIASLRGVRWAFLLIVVPCVAQVVLILTSAGIGTGAVRIALAAAVAVAAPFLRPGTSGRA
jgi:hypothetical protein